MELPHLLWGQKIGHAWGDGLISQCTLFKTKWRPKKNGMTFPKGVGKSLIRAIPPP